MNFKIDLKSIDLKNISLDDIQAKLKNVEKKTWIKLGTVVGAVVFFLIIFYGVLNPIVNKKKAQLDDMNLKIKETEGFNNSILVAKKKIKKIKPQYEQYSTLFHSKAEVEGLYESLSKHAAVNGLVISKIQKKKPKPVLKSGKAEQSENNLTMEMVSYYKIPVDYEIKGNFLGYIKFKRAVSKQKKMLNFDKETISVVQNDSTGAIVAKGELTIVGMPNEFF